MEERILEIVLKYYDPDWEILETKKIAKEISTHIMEFAKWCYGVHMPEIDITIDGEIEKAYDFWKTYIYKS